ncbi:hypothetical protein [Pontibacter kalidii]|uniref:hypothetical protein n=1 Tax=Pontibacter kalidii TaxID=2592049 RepID=UPI0022565764|nr:hypothetical protein [Pontibacter kalidii]
MHSAQSTSTIQKYKAVDEKPSRLRGIKSNLQRSKADLIFLFIYCIVCFLIFYAIIYLRIGTDLQLHIKLLKEYVLHNSFPNPPLYYLSIYILDLAFSSGFKISTIIVLTLASAYKYFIVANYIAEDKIQNNKCRIIRSLIIFLLMFLGPIIIYPWDGSRWYLGKFTSTIWHNSTTIFMFPIAILLFIKSIELFRRIHFKNILFVLFLSVLLILSKPSFLFALIPSLPMVYLIEVKRIDKKFVQISALMALVFALLLVQKELIYNSELDNLAYNGDESGITLAPFKVWLIWANNPLISILSSFALLITIVTLNFRVMVNKLDFKFASVLLMTSLVIYFLLAESGPRMLHANFYWQVPVAFLICYMVVIKIYLKSLWSTYGGIISWKEIKLKDYFILTMYSMHLGSGLLYIAKLIIFKHYR